MENYVNLLSKQNGFYTKTLNLFNLIFYYLIFNLFPSFK